MMQVTLLDYMGTDLSVVNAARVSFDKESELVDGTVKLDCDGEYIEQVLSEADTKLIHYLAKHKHMSPFGHCFASFRIKAPIFVARQLVKHKFLRWNEVSRRYVDSEPEFYVPDVWRKKAVNVKQGSSDETVDLDKHCYWEGKHIQDIIAEGRCVAKKYHEGVYPEEGTSITEVLEDHREDALQMYDTLRKAGVCPEQARMVLPY